jgi:acyl-CoA reductase-like NAD-dependent aldehyde dehydrogenase
VTSEDRMKTYQHYIDGQWLDPAGGHWLDSINPFDRMPWARVPRGNAADVARAVAAARRAFDRGPWRSFTPTQRGALLRRLGDLIARDAEPLARLETRDNGKLFAEMHKQLTYVPQWFHYFGGLADKIEGSVIPTDKPRMLSLTGHEPLGVVVAITAWNSPLLLAAYKLAPALAAGNTVILKPSEHASVSSLAFARLIEEAGFPPGVINVVTGLGSEIGDELVGHPDVAKITFTGSEATGRRINCLAAQGFKRVTLELGGKSPNIVLEDADIEQAANGIVAGFLAASGQTCVAGSRLLVHRAIYDEIVGRVVELSAAARLGDPMSPETQVGPVATAQQWEKILAHIETARNEGARCLLGGSVPTDPGLASGWFVEPTIFDAVTSSMHIAREEVFGPVLAVIPFDDEDQAVTIANDTRFGLAAGIWTRDVGRALELSRRIQAGTVWINSYRVVSYMTPFGGYKASGIGRENGIEAIREYLQVKSVWLNTDRNASSPFVIR